MTVRPIAMQVLVDQAPESKLIEARSLLDQVIEDKLAGVEIDKRRLEEVVRLINVQLN